MSKPAPLDPLKTALALTARSLAGTDALEVVFSHDGPKLEGHRLTLPHPLRSLDEVSAASIRGQADRLALRFGYHDEGLHRALRPNEPEAAEVYDMLEEVRQDALGARALRGVYKNIGTLEAQRFAMREDEAKDAALSLSPQALIGLWAQHHLWHAPLPRAFLSELTHRFSDIDAVGGEFIDRLSASLNDQRAYGDQVRDLLRALGVEPPKEPPKEQLEPQDHDEEHEPQQDPSEQEDGDEQDEQPSEEERSLAEDLAGQGEKAAYAAAQSEQDRPDQQGANIDGSLNSQGDRKDSDAQTGLAYRVYSREFDEIMRAEDMAEADELERLRGYLNARLEPLALIVSRLANRLQRKLMAKQNRIWSFDLEEGVLDAARLARIVSDPTAHLSFKQEKETDFRDTVVTLLLDNSGSMRGKPIMVAAVCADILARTLERCGVKVEILGFTTKAWKGGKSREKWIREERIPNPPGRLNDIRHIIYKAADQPWRRANRNLGLMMREGLLKENIDGEALEWAYGRLLPRTEARKILMVISDGAPVDDSTLSTNPAHYLESHLRSVIKRIETEKKIELCAIGIGHDVTRYYQNALTLSDVEQLGGGLMDELTNLFERA